MLTAALGLILAAVPPVLPERVISFTLTCLAKAQAGLNAFGGIGGVAHGGGDNWWMASEGLPLLFPVTLDLRSVKLRPRIGQPITIHGDPRGEEFKKVESLALCHGRFVIGTEAVMAKDLRSGRDQDLRVIFTDQQGRYQGDLPLPAHYQRRRTGIGSSYYRGIQGLSCSPDGRELLVSLQRPLQQDGNTPISRQLLYRWQAGKHTFVLQREFLLPLTHQLGLMDSVLLGNGEGLMLENEVQPVQRNTLSHFRINDGDDIRGCISVTDCGARPATKTLVMEHIERSSGVDLRFNEVQYDAVTLGPTMADGQRTLLLVNDDDHCGTITSPTASLAPGFAGTTFTRILLPAIPPGGPRP